LYAYRDVAEEYVADRVVFLDLLSPEGLCDGMRRILENIPIDHYIEDQVYQTHILEILKKWPMFGASVFHVKVSLPT